MAKLSDTAIAELNAAERLSLIADLWDSLSDAELPLPDRQRAELERRLGQFEDDKANAVSWDDLKAELRSRTL